jgi:NADH-ubiquinone oxidoreductase chain 4
MMRMMLFFFWGAIYLSVLCLRQFDLKILVAYSSVVHIRLVIIGIFSYSNLRVKGSVIIMLAHGFCSSGMFYFLNRVYERLISRRILILKGGLMWVPAARFM